MKKQRSRATSVAPRQRQAAAHHVDLHVRVEHRGGVQELAGVPSLACADPCVLGNARRRGEVVVLTDPQREPGARDDRERGDGRSS